MSDRAIAIVQARNTSTRLPGKVLLPLAGTALLDHVLNRVSAIAGLDGACLAIPEGTAHDGLVALAARRADVMLVRGSEDDVLSRFVTAIEATGADTVIRLTADCPFIDPGICAGMLALQRASGFCYVRNAFESGLPHGLDVEVVRAASLIEASRRNPDSYEREHVTPYLWRRPAEFPALLVDHRPDRRHWRLAVDTPQDYELAQAIFARLYPADPMFGYAAIAALIDREPELIKINAACRQKPYQGRPDRSD
ncbi:MAG: glycosyltransferase family protein [Pseudorhodoplanes sp.]|nr:glycosyltransferase family protein [Pseudorhodoplanes sp.]GIK79312.1 MAG: flagellin modification protein FlmC [Alphaproteobacteria bacterium]